MILVMVSLSDVAGDDVVAGCLEFDSNQAPRGVSASRRTDAFTHLGDGLVDERQCPLSVAALAGRRRASPARAFCSDAIVPRMCDCTPMA